MRDNQKSALYQWERAVVAPRSGRLVRFEDAQTFVDGIFICERLMYPPTVRLMPNQATKIWARGCREYLDIRPVTPAWVIIHELAHTLTMAIDDNREGHGENFVGVYIKLLDKYCGIPLALSMYSLAQTKVKYNLVAKPVFIAA